MIARLHGTVHKTQPGVMVIDVQGVGYLVAVPLPLWDALQEGRTAAVWTATYLREDRLELYGFDTAPERRLFVELIELSGVGPKLALELCSVPREMLLHAVAGQDVAILTAIKGVGKKTAEKLLLELRNLQEREPELLHAAHMKGVPGYDADAAEALASLGYDRPTIARALRDLPPALATTEERVAAALRSL